MAKEKFAFQAEVGKLLDIVARSLYSHKEIFLRELISNASDACDKLRYAALTQPDLAGLKDGGGFRVVLSTDDKASTLSIADNGIGMNRDDLTGLLGTIARSGAQAFIDQMSDDSQKDASLSGLIGQFGVGFYSAFMVAGKVEVLTRKAGEDQAWSWVSDGKGEYTIDEAERDGHGTTVILHLAKKEKEFLDQSRLSHIVKSYSDHVGIPIVFSKDGKEETLNTASALWARDKKNITEDQYKEFYHHVSHSFDEPWMTLHNRVEGVISYINLLYIPSMAPFDLFDPARKNAVKLYVNKVFITDNCEGLLPPYLRFLRGVVDSEDLSLNVSREMLQHDPKLAKIRSGLVKRVLAALKKKAEKEPEEYAKFWDAFGGVLKEGIYDDPVNRDRILEASRFHSTAGDGLVSLASYVEDMKEGQEAICYITGTDLEVIKESPQLEGFRARGVQVLLLADPVDEFWLDAVGTYKEKPFKSVTRGGADLDKVAAPEKDKKKDDDDKADATAMDNLVAAFKLALGESVKDVCVSSRLTESPVCLVAGEGDMDMNMERLLKRHKQLTAAMPRVLEINPDHSLIRRLADLVAKGNGGGYTLQDTLADAAFLLLDQARIVEGEPIPDPAAFSRRMASVMEGGIRI